MIQLFTAGCLAILALHLPAAGLQDVQVTAAVSADTVGVQDQFQFTIRISGADIGDAQAPRLPRFRGFRIVGGPSVSNQFQWINGRTSQSRSYSYILIPEREGQYRIDPVEVVVGGQTYETDAIDVRVTASSVSPVPRQSRSSDPFGDPDPGAQRPRALKEEIRVVAELDRPSAYLGQQVTLSYYLYTQVSVSGLQLQENPPLNGFWVENLEVDSNPTAMRRTLEGKEYAVYLVKRVALFPNATGKLAIPPATFAISSRSSGNFFGLFGQAETISRKTEPLSLEVRSLPSSGQAGDGGNAVGNFTLTRTLNRNQAATGEAVTLTVKLAGAGNLRIIPDLKLPAMPDFTVYSSKRTENIGADERDRIRGDRTWEYVLVPRVPGQHEIPVIAFSFFDPEGGEYRTVTAPALSLDVSRGAATESMVPGLSPANKQALTRQGTDINFIMLSDDDLKTTGVLPYRTVWFYTVAALPLFLNIGTYVYRRERFRRPADIILSRRRRARRVALGRLKAAVKSGREDPRRFYDDAAMALSGYLQDRFQLPDIALTGDSLERDLAQKSVTAELVREATSCLHECDFGRFVSASSPPGKTAQLARRIRQVIDQLERC